MLDNLCVIVPFITNKNGRGHELKIFLVLLLDLFRENVHFGRLVFIIM